VKIDFSLLDSLNDHFEAKHQFTTSKIMIETGYSVSSYSETVEDFHTSNQNLQITSSLNESENENTFLNNRSTPNYSNSLLTSSEFQDKVLSDSDFVSKFTNEALLNDTLELDQEESFIYK
jgi:hypothetical protein